MSRTYRKEPYRFTQSWGNSGRGKYMKRLLSKARRRFIKMWIRFGRAKSPSNYESEVNWRGW